MNNKTLWSVASDTTFVIAAGIVAYALYIVNIIVLEWSLSHISVPTESFAAIGYLRKSGLVRWLLALCDHLFRILLVSSLFAASASLVLNFIKRLDLKLSTILSVVFGIIYAVGIYVEFSNPENCTPNILPIPDVIISVIVFALFFYLSIPRKAWKTKPKAFHSLVGAALSIVACIVIQYVALAIALYAHVISSLLDKWTYVDMTAGQDWSIVHLLISLFSHFHNIVFFGSVALIGIYACFRTISFLVSDNMSVRFLQSIVSLWSLEFLLYAVTDEKSMKGAMFDTFDFSVLILLFALIAIATLFGLFADLGVDKKQKNKI